MYNFDELLKSYNSGITIDILTERHDNYVHYKKYDVHNIGSVFIVGIWKYYRDDQLPRLNAVHSSLGDIIPVPFNRFKFIDIKWANFQWGNKNLSSNILYNNDRYGKEDINTFVLERFSYV